MFLGVLKDQWEGSSGAPVTRRNRRRADSEEDQPGHQRQRVLRSGKKLEEKVEEKEESAGSKGKKDRRRAGRADAGEYWADLNAKDAEPLFSLQEERSRTPTLFGLRSSFSLWCVLSV